MAYTAGRIVPLRIDVRSIVGSTVPRRNYATHGVDHYPAKMVPHLAHYAIGVVSEEADTILDPFCGCGTVQVESLILGRHSIGFDINPVAVALARAKSAIYDTGKFRALTEQVVCWASQDKRLSRCYPAMLDYWFTEVTLRKLLALTSAIRECRRRLSLSQYNVLRAALMISVRKCSKADPRSPKPFISKQARSERAGKHFDSHRIFLDVASMIADASDDLSSRRRGAVSASTSLGDARTLRRSDLGFSVDAIVTSPPYLSAQDYFRSSKLELAVAGMWKPGIESSLGGRIIGSGRGKMAASRRIDFGRRNAVRLPRKLREVNPRGARLVSKYLTDMKEALRCAYNLLRRKGRCCLVVGDSKMSGLQLPVHKWFLEMAAEIGFRMFKHEMDTIRDRRVPPKREGHTSVIEQEHLLFFEKP